MRRGGRAEAGPTGPGGGPELSEAAVRGNVGVLEYSRTVQSAAAGAVAGILGLTSLAGFAFYFLTALVQVRALGWEWDERERRMVALCAGSAVVGEGGRRAGFLLPVLVHAPQPLPPLRPLHLHPFLDLPLWHGPRLLTMSSVFFGAGVTV